LILYRGVSATGGTFKSEIIQTIYSNRKTDNPIIAWTTRDKVVKSQGFELPNYCLKTEKAT